MGMASYPAKILAVPSAFSLVALILKSFLNLLFISASLFFGRRYERQSRSAASPNLEHPKDASVGNAKPEIQA